MLSRKFVRLHMPWSATPQPRRLTTSRARRHSNEGEIRWVIAAACLAPYRVSFSPADPADFASGYPSKTICAAAAMIHAPSVTSVRRSRPAGSAPSRRRYQGRDIGAHIEVTRRILIIVQNLPVPFDRRVWLECQALTDGGYHVAVVCPKGKGDPGYQVIDGVELYKYEPYAPGGSRLSFVAEYAYSFAATAWKTLLARRRGRFAVIQACNPPDIFWPLAMAFKTAERTRFVFDHHDLCPELFESRFGGRSLPYKGLRFLERRTHRAADHVISTNESYRDIAITRSGKDPADVTVVRTGPDPDKLQRETPDEGQKRGRRHLAAYIGVMGPQDGVDIVVRAAGVIVHDLGRADIAFTLIGKGDCF